MSDSSERDPYDEQMRRLRRILGPQLGRLRQLQTLQGQIARSFGANFVRRQQEQIRLVARNEATITALTAGARTWRLVDPKALESVAMLNRSFTALSKSMTPGVAELMRGFYDLRRPLITEQFKRALETFPEAWERSLPPNWEGHDDPDEVRRLIDFMEETGWCLVWAPNWSVIEALLAADVEARVDVLHAREDEILADLESCLAGVQRPEVEELRTAAAQALQAYKPAAPIPTQAAATVVLTSAIHVHFGIRTFPRARDKFGEKSAMEVGIHRFRLQAILRVAYHALAGFYGRPGEAVPVKFNRHASTHRVSKEQFNRTNALAALMLVVPLVRELDHWFARKAAEDADAA